MYHSLSLMPETASGRRAPPSLLLSISSNANLKGRPPLTLNRSPELRLKVLHPRIFSINRLPPQARPGNSALGLAMARQPRLRNVRVPRRHGRRPFDTQLANLLGLRPAGYRQMALLKRHIQTAHRNVARQRPARRGENDAAPARLEIATAVLKHVQRAEDVKTSQVSNVDVVDIPRAIAPGDAVAILQHLRHHDGNREARLLKQALTRPKGARRLDADGTHAQLLAQAQHAQLRRQPAH